MARVFVLVLAALFLGVGRSGAEQPVPVEVEEARPSATAGRLRLTGTVTAERRARLSPRASGLVALVRVDAGDRVEAGAVLVELDPELAQIALRAARASLDEARARLVEARRLHEEAVPLVEERHLPETEASARAANVRLHEAIVARLEAEVAERASRVERHRVVAPFDGVISRKLTEAGEWVETGTAVVDLVAIDRVRLDVQVPQERFAEIDEETEVSVRLDGRTGDTFPGRVIAKVPVNDPGARTFLVRVQVDETKGRMIPGMSAEAEFAIRGEGGGLLVPRDAIVREADGSHRLWVVEGRDGDLHASSRRVRIGRSLRETVEVLEGLEGPLRVVIRGNENLREGQPVRLVGKGE